MPELFWVGREIGRVDAVEKVTGRAVYPSDVRVEGMLHAKLLLAKHPHALIKRIDTSRAERYPGVVAVLTHRDVPGLNAYGIIVQDKPVFCKDRVRYLGDVVAMVVAEGREAAERALELIDVEYEPLPAVEDPLVAMEPGAPRVHEGGNVLKHLRVRRGDVEEGFRGARVVVENTYRTGRQMHAYIETEAAVAYVDGDGRLVLVTCGQHPYRDRLQVARTLGIPEDRVKVVVPYQGGAFGGKDEITVQIHAALAALKTGRPVKLWWSREESAVAGWKRHPMVIYMKTGAAEDGRIVAHRARIVADKGPYASLGPAVLDVAVECCCGPYSIENVDIEAYLVYTNNPVSGAMRGFGAPEVHFAMESQVDELARELGIDPIEIRLRNAMESGSTTSMGSVVRGSLGVKEALEAAGSTELWKRRGEWKERASRPWVRRGVGVAAGVKGVGFGALPDHAEASVELVEGGRFTIGVTPPEMGQGSETVFVKIAAETLRCDIGSVVVGPLRTGEVPDTGSAAASKTTYTAGNAIVAAASRMLQRMREVAAEALGVGVESLETGFERVFVRGDPSTFLTYAEIAELMRERGVERRAVGGFGWLVEGPMWGSLEIPHWLYSSAVQVVGVEVDVLTGRVEVREAFLIPDSGRVVNPEAFKGQNEGGFIMGIGYALMEDLVTEGCVPRNIGLSAYHVPTIKDSPREIHVIPVEKEEPTGPYGAKGVGELSIVPTAAAIANAVRDAVGVRITKIPVRPEDLLLRLQRWA